MADPTYAMFVCAVFVLAGAVKGVIGMGLPTVAVGLLGLALAPAQAAALMVVPSLVTNFWQALAGAHLRVLLQRFRTLLLALCAGTWISAAAWDGGKASLATAALGIALVLYASLGLCAVQLRVSREAEGWLSPVAGLFTGLVAGVTGVFVMPSVPYLQAVITDRDQLVQALGLTFLVGTLAIALGLAGTGGFGLRAASHSLLSLIPALVGMGIGQCARRRISPRTFRLCFFIGTWLLGAHLAARPFLS